MAHVPSHRPSGEPQPSGKEGAGALVLMPTYNELGNLPIILERLTRALPDIDVLVIDDGSPDGTGELADTLAAKRPEEGGQGRIYVMHRTAKDGLGAAYIAGFRWALERDYRVVIEMDADGSHAPEQLHRLLDRVNSGADLVIGSRYVPGGTTVNWPLSRQLISRGGNLYSRIALGTWHVRDITAGFRAYRREVLEKLDLDAIEAHGYCFQIDLAWRTHLAGFTIAEVPITFTEREIGDSKMSGSIFKEAALKVPRWGLEHRLRRFRNRR